MQFFYSLLNIGVKQTIDPKIRRRIRIVTIFLLTMVLVQGTLIVATPNGIYNWLLFVSGCILLWINSINFKISRAALLIILVVQRVVYTWLNPGEKEEYWFLCYTLFALCMYKSRDSRIICAVILLVMAFTFYIDQSYSFRTTLFMSIFCIVGTLLFYMYTNELDEYGRELLEKNRTIEDQAKQLKEADELKTRFFINVSHEFRTPVTIVQGIIENIRSGMYGALPGTISEKLKKAGNGASHLLQLVSNMLDLTKLEKGAMELNEKPMPIHDILNRQAEIFRTVALNRQITISVKHDDQPQFLLMDEEKMESVISNLLSNALKFTPSGGKIVIETGVNSKEGCLWIKVSDSGTGIPKKDLPYIFDRFYQAGVKKMQGGTGVGLALVKELMNLHGGSVSVESEEGKGTAFTLLLPASRMIGEETIRAYPEKLPEGSFRENQVKVKKYSGKSILIVEDNDEMAEYLQDLLLNESYQVEWASGGMTGLEKLKKGSYDLIITDYMMPDMDGKEFTENVKSSDKFKNIPLIFLTARNEKEGKLDVLRLGVDDYILKPFYREELLLKITNLLHNADSRKKYLVATELEPGAPEDEKFLLKVRSFVDQNMSNSRYKLTDLAEDMNTTERQVFRKIKAYTGMTPNNLIKEIKLQYARQLLEQKNYSTIKEVAAKTGYENSAHFTKIFDEKFGKHPIEYLAVVSKKP